ncbi:MAG: hypothetical protein EOP58_08540, partial [Sphingomonadales bacterium]
MQQRPRISLALALAIGAALLPLAILAGWSFDVALLRGLGAPSRPIHPMTAFSFFLMASAGILSSIGLRRQAQALLMFPLIYLLLILLQHLSGLDSGISRMLFAETMASSAALQRPITPMGAVAVLAALLAALFLRSSSSAMARAWVGQVTGIAVAATLLLLTFTVATQFSAGARFIGVAAASAVPILLLCGSILASLEMVRS